MSDRAKKKAELFEEIKSLRARIAELEIDLSESRSKAAASKKNKDENSRIIQERSHFEDITKRKDVEDDLRLRNILLSTHLESSLDGILAVDEGGKILLFNRRFVEMWGIPLEVIKSKSGDQAFKSILAKVADSEGYFQREQFLYAHKNQKSREKIILDDGRVFDRYSAPMYEDNGTYIGRIWYFRDITLRIQAGEALRESGEKFRLLFESSIEPILILDENNCINDCNKAAVKIFGAGSKEELIGKASPSFTPEFQSDGRLSSEKGMEMYQKIVECGSAFSEWTHKRRDGSEFIVDTSMTLIPMGKGKVYFLIHWRDITEKKQADLERERLIKELKKALSQF